MSRVNKLRNQVPARECSNKQRAAIEQYVAEHVGPVSKVIHEVRSELVHVDVHVVPPSDSRPMWFLFTTGMSVLPMRVPSGHGILPHAELSIALPEWWPSMSRWNEPRWFWPITELKALARLPHHNRTWLGEGHTVGSFAALRPYHATTKLAAMLVMPSWIGGETTVIDAEVATELLSLWPIHADELAFKQKYGCCALLHALEGAGGSAMLDPDRPSCIAERRAS